ncbi:sporulation histidine kinase inhibitor Sda [Paenibacillus tarimensis]
MNKTFNPFHGKMIKTKNFPLSYISRVVFETIKWSCSLMKISNPFLTMRNFIKANDSVRRHATIPAMQRPVCFAPAASSETQHDAYQDKTLLLRPLNDEHLIEVYHEAKAMRLSDDFIRLIESALEQRNIAVHEING